QELERILLHAKVSCPGENSLVVVRQQIPEVRFNDPLPVILRQQGHRQGQREAAGLVAPAVLVVERDSSAFGGEPPYRLFLCRSTISLRSIRGRSGRAGGDEWGCAPPSARTSRIRPSAASVRSTSAISAVGLPLSTALSHGREPPTRAANASWPKFSSRRHARMSAPRALGVRTSMMTWL